MPNLFIITAHIDLRPVQERVIDALCDCEPPFSVSSSPYIEEECIAILF